MGKDKMKVLSLVFWLSAVSAQTPDPESDVVTTADPELPETPDPVDAQDAAQEVPEAPEAPEAPEVPEVPEVPEDVEQVNTSVTFPDCTNNDTFQLCLSTANDRRTTLCEPVRNEEEEWYGCMCDSTTEELRCYDQCQDDALARSAQEGLEPSVASFCDVAAEFREDEEEEEEEEEDDDDDDDDKDQGLSTDSSSAGSVMTSLWVIVILVF